MRASTSRKNLTINFRFNKCKKIRKEKIFGGEEKFYFEKKIYSLERQKKRKDEI